MHAELLAQYLTPGNHSISGNYFCTLLGIIIARNKEKKGFMAKGNVINECEGLLLPKLTYILGSWLGWMGNHQSSRKNEVKEANFLVDI